MSLLIIDNRAYTSEEFANSKGLHVGGSLDLSGTGITALPEGLHVGGSLDLSGTGITALPEGLHVGSFLYLYPYAVSFKAPNILCIGCQHYRIEEWAAFGDDEITKIDGLKAQRFWKVWREPLIKWARAQIMVEDAA